MPQTYPENFGWRFRLADERAFATSELDDRDWEEVDLPHVMVPLPIQYAPEDTAKVGWYRKRVDLSRCDPAERIALRCEGVATKATVWCDGVPIGSHEGAFTPFELELPSESVSTKSVMIAIRCDGSEDPLVPPFGHVVDYLVPGGIYREISLVARPVVSVDDLFVTSRPTEDEHMREVLVRYALSGDLICCASCELLITIRDPSGRKVGSARVETPEAEGAIPLLLRNVRLWESGHPELHRIEASLVRDDVVLDTWSVRTGFRDIAFTSKGFFLNGKKIKLRGLNRHQLYPYVGFAMPRRQQREDALLLRDHLGLQVVRTSHYPQSTHFLDCCDEIGLLVVTELPGWQHIGRDPRWRQNAVRQLQEMIERDRNHPCVILWGVRINESADDDELYRQTNELARSLDPSRPTTGVRNFAASRLLEDVYAYNDFTHDGVRAALADPVRVTKDRTSPYMVTEHTGHMFPCLPDDPISVRTEHALRHARVLDAMYAHERISGAIGWCMSDYQTSARFGGGDGVCHHGVCDMFRIPKLAAAVYASQQENMPVLQVCGDLRIGSYPAHAIGTVWVFTNCERVELMFRGQRVGWHEADRVRFGHLPHPPVAITDLIGERINELDGFSPGERKLLREVLNQAALTGFDLPVLRKISVALLMRRHGLSGADAIELFERFVLWWDGEDPVWEFRGYRGTQVVARTVLRPSGGSRLDLCADSAVMEEHDTYDVVRLVVSMRSDTGMLQWMSHAPVHIDVTGPARLLGPSEISLCGGSAGLYIRSIGKPGNVRVTVSSPSCEPAGTSIRVD